MSHYHVAVFAFAPDDAAFEKLLRPYDESAREFFQFFPVSEEERNRRWEAFHAMNPFWTKDDWLKRSYHLRDGVYGSFYNPHGFYDYYTLDAASYLYPLKKGFSYYADEEDAVVVDRPLKSQVDFFHIEDLHPAEYWGGRWDELMKDGDFLYPPTYYLNRYGSRDQYVKEHMRPEFPYAFVSPDGVWHSPGRVGWFALSDETKESMDAYYEEWTSFINDAPDCYVSFCDMHI